MGGVFSSTPKTVVDEDGKEYDIIEEESVDRQVIEVGDSLKVKQVMDEVVVRIIEDTGVDINFSGENIKILLMLTACGSAAFAQFYPVPFPESRMILGICCAIYFLISCILQYITSYIDGDTILLTNENKEGPALRILTTFARFQEYYVMTIENRDEKNPKPSTGRFYVGRYFTSGGEFDEDRLAADVLRLYKSHRERASTEMTFDHKTD